MSCRFYQRLYRLLPFTFWQSLLIRRHLQACPVCSPELDIGREFSRLTIKPEQISSQADLWTDIRRTLIHQSLRMSGSLRRSMTQFLAVLFIILTLLFMLVYFLVKARLIRY